MPRAWTPEQKRAQAAAMKAYWAEHKHPRIGAVATTGTLDAQRDVQDRARWEQRGFCKRCGGPLFSKKSADLGYGPDCLARQLEEGRVTYDPYTRTVTEVEADAS